MTPAIIEFSRRWGMGWHCSIDGTPEVQDAQRPMAGGRPSRDAAERGARLVLGYRHHACARATVTPAFISAIYKSLCYFESLGFVNFALALTDDEKLTDGQIGEFERQWNLVTNHVIRRYEEGKRLLVAGLDYFWEQMARPHRPAAPALDGEGGGARGGTLGR